MNRLHLVKIPLNSRKDSRPFELGNKYKNSRWNQVIFSDECSEWLSTKIGKVQAIREVDVDILNQYTVSFIFGKLYGEKES